jgi:hypothetical protein
MKALVLPLALCAALAGCASYGTVGYATSPGYTYGPYAYDWPDSGYLYGGPAVDLNFYGGRTHHWNGHRDWHGGAPGTHTLGAGPATHAMGAGPRTHAMGAGHRMGAGRMGGAGHRAGGSDGHEHH